MTVAPTRDTEAQGADEHGRSHRWDPPRRRCAQAQRRGHHLRSRRDPDHRPGPARAGVRHPLHRLPPRERRRPRRGRGRIPHQEARHLPDGVGTGLPQRACGACQRHHELLPDGADLRFQRAPSRRPPARRLRGDGPAACGQDVRQGGLPSIASRRHRPRHCPRDPHRGVRPPRRGLPRHPCRGARRGASMRRRTRARCGASSTRRRVSCPKPRRSTPRSTCWPTRNGR